MKVTTYGAAEEVTGSKHLLEINGFRIMLDCGMFQGNRKISDQKNRNIPFDLSTLNAVVLSHAHIDHSGVIPILIRQSYQGRIYATAATRDLCSTMLLDSAHIQKRDAEYLSKKKRSFIAPLYEDWDVEEVMKLFYILPYGERFEILPDIYLTLQDAGHVLGSSMPVIDFKEKGTPRRLIFTGDLGRKNIPILKDPWEPDEADIVIMESTYGDRDHDPIEKMADKLAKIINTTYERKGKIIIPSFALERAQEVVYALKLLEMRQAIPSIPVYVDSPLTVNLTEVFRMHAECFDYEIKQVMARDGDPFELDRIQYIRNVEDSMRLNELREPAIIISAAGMCEHGRILHHLRNNCEDPRNTILIVGFQAKNTLGRRIVERHREIKIFGVKRQLNAEVKVMNAFSAHAGRSELIGFATRFKKSTPKILLVHGEEKAISSLKSALQDEGVEKISVQREGEPTEA